MMVRAAPRHGGATFQLPLASLLGVAACIFATAIAAGLVAVLGYWALAVPFYLALVAGAAVAPRKFAFVFLGLCVAIEPSAIDFTRPVSVALYEMPPGFSHALGFTTSPVELLLLITVVSIYMRPSSRTRDLPAVVWLAPLVLAFGYVYGLSKGGVATIAYNESRGLIYAVVAFLIAIRMGLDHSSAIRRTILWGGGALAMIVILRYAFFLKASGVSSEDAFAHEDAAFLGIAFIAGCAFLIRARTHRERIFLVGYCMLLVAAEMASARRAGFLVLFVGGAVMVWLLLPKRPLAVLLVMIPVLTLGSAYVAAYWNKDYGALAQPARAIRSQISPSERDESSDLYRKIEKFDVEQTLHGSELFGIGFGRPFAQYQPLPPLSTFWSLQLYTPHTNVLWLWLKMGVLGITVFLSIWVLALKRCLVALRERPRADPVPVLPLVLACSLLMYLAYARVDLALVGSRSMAPLAAIVAVALCLPASRRRNGAGSAAAEAEGAEHE
jgi:hypothetical protein